MLTSRREAREYGERMRKSWSQAMDELLASRRERDRLREALRAHDDCPDCPILAHAREGE